MSEPDWRESETGAEARFDQHPDDRRPRRHGHARLRAAAGTAPTPRWSALIVGVGAGVLRHSRLANTASTASRSRS
ncbi:MAG: hypothetical protein DYH17_09705 [Xanthomonadales bacterium PRO6]|nr:hypothetical protein [Xanthomonadales bacterium PRO6]